MQLFFWRHQAGPSLRKPLKVVDCLLDLLGVRKVMNPYETLFLVMLIAPKREIPICWTSRNPGFSRINPYQVLELQFHFVCVCVCVGVCVCFVWGGASLDVILCLDVQVSAALATAESLRTLAPQQQEPGVGGASGNLMGTKINSE